jgi:hypothetical protein
VRTLAELTDVEDPAWVDVAGLIAASPVPVEVLPADRPRCEASLYQLQVSARSTLGAVALNTGGLLVDHGWLRVYGGCGMPGGMPGITEVNEFHDEQAPDGVPAHGLVIAHDVLGGVFALNLATFPACGRPGEPGEVVYFAPDSLRWEPLEGGHSAWLTWALSATLGRFYASLRWPGWENEAAGLNPRQGIHVLPPLWSREAHDNLAATSRRPVPMRELLSLHHEFLRQLTADPDPGFLGTIARLTENPA